MTERAKILKLRDCRKISGNATRALRKVLREIDLGDCTNVTLSSIRRNGTIYTFATGEDPIKQLGSLRVLETDIIQDQLKKLN